MDKTFSRARDATVTAVGSISLGNECSGINKTCARRARLRRHEKSSEQVRLSSLFGLLYFSRKVNFQSSEQEPSVSMTVRNGKHFPKMLTRALLSATGLARICAWIQFFYGFCFFHVCAPGFHSFHFHRIFPAQRRLSLSLSPFRCYLQV